MASINNSTIFSSLYLIQSRMTTLSKSANQTESSYLLYNHSKDILTPRYLQSQISNFQQDNLRLEQNLASFMRNQQLMQASESQIRMNTLSFSTSLIAEPMTLRTFSIASEPAPMFMMASEPAFATSSTSYVSPIIEANHETSANYTNLLKVRDYVAAMSPSITTVVANNNRTGFRAVYDPYKNAAETKYHLETTHGFDPFDVSHYKTETAKQNLLAMIDANLALIKNDHRLSDIDKMPPITLLNLMDGIFQQTLTNGIPTEGFEKYKKDVTDLISAYETEIGRDKSKSVLNSTIPSVMDDAFFQDEDTALTMYLLVKKATLAVSPQPNYSTIPGVDTLIALRDEIYKHVGMTLEETDFSALKTFHTTTISQYDALVGNNPNLSYSASSPYDVTKVDSFLDNDASFLLALHHIDETIRKAVTQNTPPNHSLYESKGYELLEEMMSLVLEADHMDNKLEFSPITVQHGDKFRQVVATYQSLVAGNPTLSFYANSNVDITQRYLFNYVPSQDNLKKDLSKMMQLWQTTVGTKPKELPSWAKVPPIVENPPIDVEPDPGVENPPTDGGTGSLPGTENPLPGGSDSIINPEYISNTILSIKKEYNDNQIKVYSKEYARIMDVTDAKIQSEYAKLQMMEHTNLQLLQNNNYRKENLYALLRT